MMLRPNSKGCITKSTVMRARINDEISKQVGRIVEEIKKLDESLNFEEFCKAMELLEKENEDKSDGASHMNNMGEVTFGNNK